MVRLAGISGVAEIGIEWHIKVGVLERPEEDVVLCLQLHELKYQSHRVEGWKDLPAAKRKQKAAKTYHQLLSIELADIR